MYSMNRDKKMHAAELVKLTRTLKFSVSWYNTCGIMLVSVVMEKK